MFDEGDKTEARCPCIVAGVRGISSQLQLLVKYEHRLVPVCYSTQIPNHLLLDLGVFGVAAATGAETATFRSVLIVVIIVSARILTPSDPSLAPALPDKALVDYRVHRHVHERVFRVVVVVVGELVVLLAPPCRIQRRCLATPMTRVQLMGWLQHALRRRMLIRLRTRLLLLFINWVLFYRAVDYRRPLFLLPDF